MPPINRRLNVSVRRLLDRYSTNIFKTGWLWSIWRQLPVRFRFLIYRVMIHTFGQREDLCSVYRLPFGLYVKLSRTPSEAPAMEYVRTMTTIPVPAVLDYMEIFEWPVNEENGFWTTFAAASPYHRWLIVMPALPGKPIQGPEGARLVDASQKQLQNIRDGLTDWINQLRNLTPPDPQGVSSFLGGGIYSFRIDEAFRPVGPFANPAEFHSQVFCAPYPDEADDYLNRLKAERPHKDYKINLTHGDILPFNILADDELRLTGLIDWECASWMPEYWEKAMSLRGGFIRTVIWKSIVQDSFPAYKDDMALEQCIQLTYTP